MAKNKVNYSEVREKELRNNFYQSEQHKKNKEFLQEIIKIRILLNFSECGINWIDTCDSCFGKFEEAKRKLRKLKLPVDY